MSWDNPVFPIDAKNSIVFFVSFLLKLISLVNQSRQIFLNMGCGSSTEVEKCDFDEENKV